MYTASSARYSTLPYHRCGQSGLLLPAVSLGFWHNFGASRPEQILDDLKALDNTAFTPDELRAIDAASGF